MKERERRLKMLAEFRYVLRQFLQFSEEAATRVGLPAQQHLLLLQVSGAAEGESATVAYIAKRLGLRHHSAVGLSQRCEEAGLIEREHDAQDARRVVLRTTAKGERLLDELSAAHARELHSLAPNLIASLERIQEVEKR